MDYKSRLCSCIICHKVKSIKGIFSHYISSHTKDGQLKKIKNGKMGGSKARLASKKLRADNIDQYLKNPKKCKQCCAVIPYDIKGNKFCNSSCAAKYNNLLRSPKKIEKQTIDGNKKTVYNCIHCGVERKYNHRNANKYCSISCQQEFILNQRVLDKTASSKTLKRFIIKTNGYKCWGCGISEWKNKKIVLELEHRDGNSGNNELSNLELLCPNCHSQTPTYKSKNKGKGRHTRRQRYIENKSY